MHGYKTVSIDANGSPLFGDWVEVVIDWFSTYVFGINYDGTITAVWAADGCSDSYFDEDLCANAVEGPYRSLFQITAAASASFNVATNEVGSMTLTGSEYHNKYSHFSGDVCDPNPSLDSEEYKGCITLDVNVLSYHWTPVHYGPCPS